MLVILFFAFFLIYEILDSSLPIYPPPPKVSITQTGKSYKQEEPRGYTHSSRNQKAS